MDVKCPSCQHDFKMALKAIVPNESRMVFNVTLKDADQWISAKTLGGIISANDRLLKAVARDIGGRVEVFVSDMAAKPNGVSIEFVVVDVAAKTAEHIPARLALLGAANSGGGEDAG